MLSVLLCTGLGMCYALRPDSLAAVTFLPAWVWLPAGLALTFPGLWRRCRSAGLVALWWVIFVLVFCEEPVSLARGLVSGWSADRTRETIRVVSLNCAGGNLAAAREVKAFRPDIVLLQESPPAGEVEQLARELFGHDAGVLSGIDASIVVRGSVEPYFADRIRAMCVAGRVRLKSGETTDVASMRLVPPVLRMDLWAPGCWRDQASNRRARRAELRLIVGELARVSGDRPLIAGGDLNAPAGDGAFDEMKPRLRDAFKQAGRGWGHTVLGDFPVQRVDQVWVSRHFGAKSVTAHKAIHSDHRMVVCDVFWHQERKHGKGF